MSTGSQPARGRAGFTYLMHNPVRERLSICVTSAASMEVALTEAIGFTKNRSASGRRIADFQDTRFTLAELATEGQIAGFSSADASLNTSRTR